MTKGILCQSFAVENVLLQCSLTIIDADAYALILYNFWDIYYFKADMISELQEAQGHYQNIFL